MLDNPEQAVYLVVILFALSLPISYVGIVLKRKGVISKKILRYVYYPLTMLPIAVISTYVIWPANELHFILRLLVGIGFDILIWAYVYLISDPLYMLVFPSYKKRLDKDE